MGRISKGETCSVEGCDQPAVRSLSPVEASVLEKLGYKLVEKHRRIYLCEKHYKEYKKLRKKEERLEKWRYSRG